MAKEVAIPRLEEQEEKDPYFREHEHGSYLIDQIQVQKIIRVSKNKRIPPRKVPYLAQGFVYHQDMILGFKAYNSTHDVSLGMGNNWSVYAPMNPLHMDQLVGQPTLGDANYERLQEMYPDAFPLEQTDYQEYQEHFTMRANSSEKSAFNDLVVQAISDALSLAASEK